MKHFYVASFFFLLVFLFLFSGCENTTDINNSKDDLSTELDSLYRFDKSDSLRLKKINAYLKKVGDENRDTLEFRALMLKSTVYVSNKELDSAINTSKKILSLAIAKGNMKYTLKGYDKLDIYYRKDKNYEKAIEAVESYLNFVGRINDSSLKAKGYRRLGSNYKSKGNLFRAFENYNESFKINELLGENVEAGKRLHTMAKIQTSIGDFVGSKATAIDGIEFLENTSEWRDLSGLYHTVSVALKEEGKYKEALDYNDKATQLANSDSKAKKIGRSNILKFKNTKANILREQKKFKEAISIYDGLLKNPVVVNDKKEHARVLDNKGYTLWLENTENIESENLMLRALELRNEEKDNNGLIANNIHLAEYYTKEEKLLALQYAEVAYEKAKSIDAMDDTLEALYLVFTLRDSLQKRIKSNLFLEYANTVDKLTELKNKTQEIYATNKYDNDRLIKQNLKEKNRNRMISIVLVFVIILSILYYFFLRSKHKKKTLQAVYNTESHISKKVHDEVANDVFQVMTTLQGNTNVNEKVIDDLDHIYDKTRNIAKVHSVLDYEGDFKDTLNDLLLSYDNEMTRVIVKDVAKINWGAISKMKKQTIYKVLQEFMVNMKKHSEAEIVALTFKTIRKKIAITYSDDGVGTNLKKSTGLQNVENRIKSIKGTIIFESEINKGFKSKITV